MLVVSHFEDVTMIRMARQVGTPSAPGPAYWCAAFLVDGLLVDTGCAHTAPELLAFLADKRVERVVNTHYHEDHVGANRRLQHQRGTAIYAHQDCLPLIGCVPTLLAYRQMIWGVPQASNADPAPSEIATDRHRFRVIETPGHCRGHISLVEPELGWVFTGDAYVTATPKAARPEEDLGQLVRDMRRLADTDSERLALFNAIGTIIEDGRRALDQCAAYLERVIAQATDLARQHLSVAEIRERMFGAETALAVVTEGDFSIENLLRSALRSQL